MQHNVFTCEKAYLFVNYIGVGGALALPLGELAKIFDF